MTESITTTGGGCGSGSSSNSGAVAVVVVSVLVVAVAKQVMGPDKVRFNWIQISWTISVWIRMQICCTITVS